MTPRDGHRRDPPLSRRPVVYPAAAVVFMMALGSLPRLADRSDQDEVRHLLEKGRYAEARQHAAANLERVRAVERADSLAAAQALDLWIEARVADGDRSVDLLSLAEGALERNELLSGPEDPRIVPSLMNLAFLEWAIRNSARGLEGFDRALDLRREHLGEEHLDTLASALWTATVLRNVGEYEKARSLVEGACDVAEAAHGPDSVVFSRLLAERGRLLWQLDELEEARRHLEQAVRIQEERLGVHPELARTLNHLAVLEWTEANYVEARALYERQLEIQKQTLRPEHPDFGTTWLNLGILLWSTGDLQGAKEYFDRSRALPVHRESPDHAGRGFQNYARLALEMGDYAGARELMEKLKEVRERVLLPKDPLIMRAYWDLGALYRDIGEWERSRAYLERALSLCAGIHGAAHTRHAEVLHDLGLLEERTGDLAAARRRMEQAIAVTESALGSEHPMTTRLRGDLGRILWRQGFALRALDLSLQAAGQHRAHVARVARYFSERETLLAEAYRLSAIQTAYLILARPNASPEIIARVWDEVTRGRALVLDAIGSRHRRALGAESGAVAAARRDLEVACRKFARLILNGPGQGNVEEYGRRLDAAREEKERLERRLAELGVPSSDDSGGLEAGLGEVRASLPRGAALVAFVEFDGLPVASHGVVGFRAGPPPRARRSYLGLVLGPGSEAPAVVWLGDADEVDRAIDRWRAEVSARPRSGADIERYLEAGRRLRASVWDPIADRLGSPEEVFLVPEGALHLVSFAALPDDGGRYLVERIRFHYLSSERDLVLPAAREAPGRGLLALGGADFDAEPGAPATPAEGAVLARSLPDALPSTEIFRGLHSTCTGFQSLRFPPLPGSEAEAIELAELFRSRSASPATGGGEPVTLLTGAEAAEDLLKRSVRGHRIIHLATHGFMIGSACESSLPEPGTRSADSGALPSPRTVVENPLLLSGIALTSANRRNQADFDQDDGVLTAEEAASLDLRGVEWAVLAGCGTGLGPVQTGEGVLGLRRAFRVAGARTLLLSLWPVEDHAARQWFRQLYQARLGGDATPVAVQRASLDVLSRRRAAGTTTHPFFWGAFVAAGDSK